MIIAKLLSYISGKLDRWLLHLPRRFQFIVNSVETQTFPEISGWPIIVNRGVFRVGSNVTIVSKMKSNPVGGRTKSCFFVSPTGVLSIGNNVAISNSVFFVTNRIEIEDDVFIGGGVQLYDSDFHSLDYTNRMKRPDPDVKSAPIKICHGAFIGTSAIIMKGVVVGSKSVIAAGAIVTKSIPPNEIWGGNPAKYLRKVNLNE